MKKITTLALLLMAGVCSHAQYSYEAADDYGRLEGITYDLETQNKLYAVSLNNHIVVSYDNGVTWDLLFAFPDTTARLTNLRMLPGNENLCFSVLNGDFANNGIHVFNVEDNEIISTIPMPVLEGFPTVNNFDIYDGEASTIILNVYNSGHHIFYTTTGGENWTEIYDMADYNDVAIQSVAISPDDPTKLFMTRGGSPNDIDGGIFISTDSGETWTGKLEGVVLNPIAFKPGVASEIMVGTDMFDFDTPENLYRSVDGGETWNIVPAAWTDFVTDHFTVIKYHPTNPEIIYVLEENEIGFSEDGGTTWQITAYPEEVYYVGLSVSVNPFQNKEAVFTANMYPVKTADGGLTLTQVKAPFYNIGSISAVKFGTTEHLYYGAQGGLLHKNYATNATDAYGIEPASAFSPSQNQVIADPLNEGRLFISEGGGFMGGNLYVSTDHGATRSTLMSSSGFISLAVDPANDNIVYVVLDEWGNGALHKLDITNLDNVVATPVTTPGDSGYIGGILAYTGHLVLAKNGTVYKSTDDGATWTELYTVDGATISDLSANPIVTNGFGIATSNGVFTTADAGATWTEALAGVEARKLEFSDLNAGVMAVGVYNGVNTADAYITYYNGSNWETVSSEEMNYIQSYGMSFNFIGGNINAYIATVDMGVIRYSFPIENLGTDTPSLVSDKVILAPNPASDILTVQTSQLASVKNVAIYSITGQKVLESAQPTINVSHLSKGIYVVKAETASGEVASVKLVKE